MKEDTFHIEKLVHGGLGLSHDSCGKAVLLEGVIAGEDVSATIYSTTKNLLQGQATQIHKTSPNRVQPPCKQYTRCGGCNFQHISYSGQLQAKKAVIEDLLLRSGHQALIRAAHEILKFPISSDRKDHYRQRIRMQVDNRQTLGFFKRRSNDCIAVSSCLLAKKEINDCLEKLLQQQQFKKLLSCTYSLELLFNPGNSQITLILHFYRRARPTDKRNATELTRAIANLENVFFFAKGFAPSGKSLFTVAIPPLHTFTDKHITLFWETGGFCQVNLDQNLKLIQTVLDYSSVTENESILDLFCGMGNFSIPLAMRANSVLGIEGQGSAIRSARKNSEDAGQENTTFTKQSVHDACRVMADEDKQFDTVIIDPPRQGAPGLATQLTQLTKKRLIYISCDPATLCRDLAELLDQGFQLTKLQPVDMFPQTHHIECVALLEKDPENH
ncbi:MAG: hypothetical protein DSY80_05055 [Desulfocapsa sp.]|nr:MAG: hypothetical protein DSY80_05055 [Desulfocapsa sp.]